MTVARKIRNEKLREQQFMEGYGRCLEDTRVYGTLVEMLGANMGGVQMSNG